MATPEPAPSTANRRPTADPVTVADLTMDPRRARRHPARNIDTIVRALREVGAARSLVIDEHGMVLAGNATVQAAIQAGLTALHIVDTDGTVVVAVRRQGLTAAQKARLALYDNRAAELAGGWNLEVLKALQADGVSLEGLWTLEELAQLMAREAPAGGLTDPDAVPAARPTDIAPGDVFELGHHRVLCGDSTKPEDVARLLGADRPLLMVTDPPYGVEYDPGWRATAGLNKNHQKMGTVTNDDRTDWTPAWALFAGDVAYVWHAGRFTSQVQTSLERAGFQIRNQIIWAKDRFALSRGHYHWQHEPCWYAVRAGATAHWTGDRSQTTLWQIPAREDGGHGHGTQKPVQCMARAIRNHGTPGAVVYEPFSGSGTTLIACEQLGRKCRAIEIEPTYVQMAIDRWERFTGKASTKGCA